MRSIRRRLVAQYVAIILLTVILLEGASIALIWRYYYGSVEQTLVNRSAVAAVFYDKYLALNSVTERARSIMDNLVGADIARVEVWNPEGAIIQRSDGFASASPPGTAGSGAEVRVPLPRDVKAALAGQVQIWRGRDPNTGERLLAVAQPLHESGRIVGALRYVSSVDDVHRAALQVTYGAAAIGATVVVLAVFISLLLARSIVDPVREVTAVAAQLATGRRDVRATKRVDDEIGRLADTLNYLTDELVRSERVKSDFLSSISHELRTPLTAIKGWGETLRSGGLAVDESVQGLDVICSETDRVIGLVEELLDFSRLQAGRMAVNLEPFEVAPLLETVRHEFALRAEGTGIALRTDIRIGLPTVDADPARLKQVLVNLVDNALKFTPDGGGVTIAALPGETGVRIEVRDNGIGIDPTVLPRVTERFFKADPKRPGSGLGLSIVAEIVRLHHGALSIDSEPGVGTTVAVELPRSAQHHARPGGAAGAEATNR